VPGGINAGPAQTEAVLTPATRAVVVFHLYSEPVQAEAIDALCARRVQPLVQDAARANGSAHLGRVAGSWGTVATFRFYAGKNLGAFGNAGAVTRWCPVIAARGGGATMARWSTTATMPMTATRGSICGRPRCCGRQSAAFAGFERTLAYERSAQFAGPG
jgi:hypothetical protein